MYFCHDYRQIRLFSDQVGFNRNSQPEMNLSTLRPKDRGMLKVHPEPRFLPPLFKDGIHAVERVNSLEKDI